MRYLSYLLITVTFFGCGINTDLLTALKKKIKSLQIVSSNLQALIESDYSSCPASGDTADALIRKICNVAQAATAEARVELKSELAVFSQQLQGQIDAVNQDLVSHQASIDVLNATVVNIQSDIVTLQGQIVSINSAISALQATTASINGTLAGNMISIDIGSENVSAGPLYETVLRRNDRKRFNGYVQSYGIVQALGNNPFTSTNASTTVTVSLNAHGYVAGDIVSFQGLVGSRGFTNAQVYGEFVAQTATTNSFTITMSVTASSSGTLGGTVGLVQKVNGRGMATLWQAGDASDTSVRVSNLGSRRYNFIIRRLASDVTNQTGELCYSKTNNSATFVTINAAPEGGNSSIVCK